MKSLIQIEKIADNLKRKSELLNSFRDKFTDAKLTKTVKIGASDKSTVVVSEKDPIHSTAYEIFRIDLMRYLAALSDDITIPANLSNISLKDFLQTIIDESVIHSSHPLNNNKRAIWIDLAYGMSAPRAVDTHIVPGSKELHLILTAVTDGNHPADKNIGVLCASTATMSVGGGPTDPPISGPVHPKDGITE